jgi:uncharacterized protein YjiS (DUF1127 family)
MSEMMSASQTLHHHTAARLATDCGSNALARLVRRLSVAFAVSRERRALMALGDDALKDIGLSRADAYHEGTRSFWDLPLDRLR